jgi:hypothetical protein
MATDPKPLVPATLSQNVAKRTRRARSRLSAGAPPATPTSELPLAEKDGLVFRIVPPPKAAGTSPAPGPPAPDPGAMASTFRAAFADVWNRIPLAGRRELLDYWQRGPLAGLRDDELLGRRSPLIQLVDEGRCCLARPRTDRAGHVLTIPASLVTNEPHRLPGAIGRLLAAAYRLATREHWRDVMRMIEEPLERWQAGKGAAATEAQVEQKAQALEAEYLRHFEVRVAQIVRSWGMDEPHGDPDTDAGSREM